MESGQAKRWPSWGRQNARMWWLCMGEEVEQQTGAGVTQRLHCSQHLLEDQRDTTASLRIREN